MELTAMRNIGAEMKRKLNTIGITTAEELRALGSKEAYFRLKAAYPEVCTVFLYTLQGAIDGIDFNRLPQDIKDSLKAYSDGL